MAEGLVVKLPHCLALQRIWEEDDPAPDPTLYTGKNGRVQTGP